MSRSPYELEDLHEVSTTRFQAALLRMVEAAAHGRGLAGPVEHLADVVAGTQIHADLAARESVLLAADALERGERATFAVKRVKVKASEAIADLLAREPRLAKGYKEVQKVYREKHGFALAKASKRLVVQKVKDVISKHFHKGTNRLRAEEAIAELGPWTRAYAETVFRTNVTTAYNAGTFREVSDPDVYAIMPALRYDAIHDGHARPNHLAFDGMVADVHDPIWLKASPPNGYNCRCSLAHLARAQVQRMGLITKAGHVRRAVVPAGAYRDPGFVGGRPDVAIYGGQP
jgi:SPP1 gp7 family putative phage head morphogenesis protein